ncbi:MAG: hypothetical protein QOJ64_789 [Acidobacteriota bacterium]|jgi:hypothetical protein|nr:hypothetical protein [Acidobacteriota bacterium]
MDDWLDARERTLRHELKLSDDLQLLAPGVQPPKISPHVAEQLGHFNIEWHVIPSADSVPLDAAYFTRFYPMAPRGFEDPRDHSRSYRDVIINGHQKHQGRICGIETTQKPRYLPGNRQFYGTHYGVDASVDSLAIYMGRAGMTNATRYNHHYLSLREFLRVVNEDWRARDILPAGFRVTICPPAVFNLIGSIFHPEWSETETLELGFYRDDEGNATCYAVGSNALHDFSYINEVELETDWPLLGFRIALIPEDG